MSQKDEEAALTIHANPKSENGQIESLELDELVPEKKKGDEGKKTARFMVENVDSPTKSPVRMDSHEYTYPDPSADTIGFPTHEAVPMTVFYRNQSSLGDAVVQRPTLRRLHQGLDELDEETPVGFAFKIQHAPMQ